MHEHVIAISETPTHKFHKNLKNPKNFPKTQNLGLKRMNACRKRDWESYQVI